MKINSENIRDGIAYLFVVLFLYAAASKLLDYPKFKIQLGQSPLLTRFADSVAWIIPIIEIGIAMMLATPRLRANALYAAFALMVLFTAYIVAITKFSEYIPCSCGGVLQHLSWTQHFYFNLAFIALSIIAILLNPNSLSKSNFFL
jgi:uncharacterized membrane protein YphA (DoxX/SURF4 family)